MPSEAEVLLAKSGLRCQRSIERSLVKLSCTPCPLGSASGCERSEFLMLPDDSGGGAQSITLRFATTASFHDLKKLIMAFDSSAVCSEPKHSSAQHAPGESCSACADSGICAALDRSAGTNEAVIKIDQPPTGEGD
jgi:hypothetical protein